MSLENTIMFSTSPGVVIDRKNTRINMSTTFNRKCLPSSDEKNIETIWDNRKKKNSTLFNGTKFRLDTVCQLFNKETLTFTLNLGLTDYKDFIGTNWSPNAKQILQHGENEYGNTQACMSDAMGVGSLVLTADNRAIFLKRSQFCGEANGLYDIPGGHAEPSELVGKLPMQEIDLSALNEEAVIDEIYNSTLREIRDEVNVPLDSLTEPILMGIARNITSSYRPSVEFFVRCSLSGEQVEKLYHKGGAEEYESTTIVFIALDRIKSLQNDDFWNTMAPSAKGCVKLFQLSEISAE
ncbi:unnamed protein product [Owenia fusiformis]|uniref:Nudix hydrolase domain-containing protein n=1 Tax=Owenia fusiformis TaxID=6347 RepID=A0A8S4PGV3_OWEFU|nr:unnamed protein product [Owenia fusiformis]